MNGTLPDLLRVAVCEDTESDARLLLDLLQQSAVPNQPTLFPGGEEFLAAYRPERFDLLLTDIYMEGITGVEVAARLRSLEPQLPVAFITTSTDHAMEGYRLHVMRYIEKPYSREEVEEVLRLAQLRKERIPTLVVRKNGRDLRLRLGRIAYAEQENRQIAIHLTDGSQVLVYEKLSQLMPQLEALGFFQPHKSFAVNLEQVRRVDLELKGFLMNDGTLIPIRRDLLHGAKAAFEQQLFRRTREGSL